MDELNDRLLDALYIKTMKMESLILMATLTDDPGIPANSLKMVKRIK